MIRYPVKTIRLLAAMGALLFAAASGALAMEQQFADDNCAITIPDGWHTMANIPAGHDVVAGYSDDGGKRIVILQIIHKKPPRPLDDRFIAEFEKGVEESGGGTRLSGKYIQVGGIKSYERVGTLISSGKQISTMGLLVPGEDRYCNLQALRFDGDASEDPEIQQVMSSFRFLHAFVPTYEPDSMAYRIGKLTGALTVFVVVIVLVVRGVLSNRTPRQPQPPPLPPGAS